MLAIVILPLLLWILIPEKEEVAPSKEQEAVEVKSEPQLPAIQPDTIASVIAQYTVKPMLKEQPRKRVSPKKKETIVKAREEKVQPEAPVFQDLTLAPLSAEALLAANVEKQREYLPELACEVVVSDKREYDWKADTLPVKRGIDLLRIKRVGRYDRGIVNYRFMPKGQLLVGLDFSFWNFDSNDSKLLFGYLDKFNFDARTVSVNPFLGYFFRDNQAIGMRWGYRKISGSLGNASIKIDEDVNFSIKDLGLKEEIYSCTFFHRSYVGLDAGKRFGLFNETSLRLGYGKSVFTRGADEALKETTTDIFESQLGISPGLAVFIMENVSVECSIGVIGLRYRQEKQANTLGETGQRRNGGANFKINLFDINLGLIISL